MSSKVKKLYFNPKLTGSLGGLKMFSKLRKINKKEAKTKDYITTFKKNHF